ncbi:MAG: hypothetical protein IKP28_00070 [Clostridia bacterium]|nr:hypothetical protein [Clostridia bacterium]
MENKIKKTTKYGEFICSLEHWLPIDEQKEKSKKLEKITDDKTNREDKQRKK